MSTIDIINAALDRYMGRARTAAATLGKTTPQRFRRTSLLIDVRHITGNQAITADDVSNWLQDYRIAQTGGTPQRYTIFAEGYARAAVWHIVAGPGIDTNRSEAVLMEHREYVVRDVADRLARDLEHELAAARHAHPVLDAYVTRMVEAAASSAMSALIGNVEAATELFEQLTGRNVELESATLSSEDQAVLAEMLATP